MFVWKKSILPLSFWNSGRRLWIIDVQIEFEQGEIQRNKRKHDQLELNSEHGNWLETK